MHTVRACSRERKVQVPVTVKVHPVSAVVGILLEHYVRRDICERRAIVVEQVVAVRDVATDGAVDVHVQSAIVVEVSPCACVVAAVNRQAQLFCYIHESGTAVVP